MKPRLQMVRHLFEKKSFNRSQKKEGVLMKKCKRCNGTGRRISPRKSTQLTPTGEGSSNFYGLIFGVQYNTFDKCPYCMNGFKVK